MSVESQFKAQIDHIAAVKVAFVAAIASRSTSALWTMVDAAADITYENRVKGAQVTIVDGNVSNVEIASMFADWFRLHNEYFSVDAGLTLSSTPLTTIKAAIEDYYRWRVPQYFNAIMIKVLGQGLAVKNVAPRNDLSLGTYAASSSSAGTFTDGSALETTLADPGVVGVYATTVIGGNNLVLSVTCKHEDDTTTAVAVTMPTTSAIGTKRLIGQQALTTNHVAASDGGVVLVAATGQFKAGMKVLIKDDNNQEVAEVASLSTNTSLTLRKIGTTTAGLRNNYTTAATALVFPLYKDVTAVTNSNGTNLDAVQFKFEPDRAISLT